MRLIQILTVCSGIGILCAGCASQQPNTVRQTLQSYQVGVTKFKDFKRDAGLIELSHKADEGLQAQRYGVPLESRWKLYGEGQNASFSHWSSTFTWKFVVGDTDEAICTLWFDASGTLVAISTPQTP